MPKCSGPKPITTLVISSEDFKNHASEVLSKITGHYCVRVMSPSGAMLTIGGCVDLDECDGCLDCNWSKRQYVLEKFKPK